MWGGLHHRRFQLSGASNNIMLTVNAAIPSEITPDVSLLRI
jgi:hypothetical protein